jgi:hypothetical protein
MNIRERARIFSAVISVVFIEVAMLVIGQDEGGAEDGGDFDRAGGERISAPSSTTCGRPLGRGPVQPRACPDAPV